MMTPVSGPFLVECPLCHQQRQMFTCESNPRSPVACKPCHIAETGRGREARRLEVAQLFADAAADHAVEMRRNARKLADSADQK